MRKILLTGVPGCGKTTVISKIVDRLGKGDFQRPVAGFVTREIRSGGQREGFEIVTLSGKSALLAHINHPKTYPKTHVVGKYGVDVDAFEALAIEELSKPAAVFIIDEIGKMETLFSKRFNATVRKILDNPNVVVVGTVAMQGGGFIGEVRHSKGIEIIEVTQANRNDLPEKLLQGITDCFVKQ